MYIRLIILFTFLFLHTTVFAQSTPKAYHSDRTEAHVGESLIVGSYGTAGVKITGSGTFEVTFQVKAFNTTSWDDVQCRNVTDASESTTASANGSWQCPVAGFGEFRVNLTTCSSCSVTATGYGTQAARGGASSSGSGSGITAGTSFPGSPSTNQLFLITDDSAAGECDSDAGSAVTLCRYDGADWQPVNILAEAQGLGDVITINRTHGGAVSQATGVRIGDDGSSEYWNLHRDATTGLTFDCEKSGVLGDCNKKIKIYTGHVFDFLNNANTSIAKLTESTGAWTNFTIDGEGSGNTITLTEEKHFRVASCQNTTAQAVFDLFTSNTPAPTCDTGTNTQKAYLAFDATTDEAFQDGWILPTGFTGEIDIHFRWKAAATSGAVGWCAQLVRVPDAATSDPAYPAQAAGNCVSDTAKGTTLQENTATISGVTCTSCVAGDHVYVRISRDANGGAVTDDMTGDALLLTYGRTWRVAH